MLTKVILQANIDKVAKYFERADKIVIVTHVSPDGDALGSSLGLLHFLETQEKNVHIIVPNAFPDFLRWMPGAKDIIRYDKYSEFADELIAEADVICCLDFNALSRIDAMAKPVAASAGRTETEPELLVCLDNCFDIFCHPISQCFFNCYPRRTILGSVGRSRSVGIASPPSATFSPVWAAWRRRRIMQFFEYGQLKPGLAPALLFFIIVE